MDLGSHWRIGTSVGQVHLRLLRADDARAPTKPNDLERARFLVLFELPNSSEAQRALGELRQQLRGEREPSFALLPLGAGATFGQETELAELRRLLEAELDAGRVQLEFEPFGGVFHGRDQLDIALPELPAARKPEAETSSIAVRLIDQKGVAITNRPVQIELPNGSVHNLFTDPDGFARVKGFTEDGNAKIIFPSFDELDFKTKGSFERIVIPVGDTPLVDPFDGLSEESDEDDALDDLEELASEVEPEPQPDPATFTLVVLDDVGGPVAGVDVTLESPDGPQTFTTDDTGTVQFDNAVGPVNAFFDDMVQLRKVLRPRFLAPREPQTFDDSNAIVRPLSQLVNAIALPPDKPLTLLLTASIECHEIPGVNFEFGRSFVRSSAIEQLADIAEALRNTVDVQAMIFGHTDLSGSEALNKELSERRAHAVHALLTHDSVAWEKLFSGTADGANWQEKWDIEEAQNMLNALGCTDDTGAPLTETGKRDAPTKQAIRRFQRGEFPSRPAEQRPLPESDFLGVDGRRALFLAYAKRISRQPIAPDRFLAINGAPFMGCGEFNALSLSAKDAASRRVNVFLFDPVVAPEKLPCKLRQLGPCRANLDPKPTELEPNGKAPFRCRVFQGLATKCTAAPSPDLDHDLVLRFPLQLIDANQLAHKYSLQADDGTLTFERTLLDDARAADDTLVELSFEHLPENHRYRLMCDDGEQPPYAVFEFATLKELQDNFRADLVALDLVVPSDFLQHATVPNAVATAPSGVPDDDDADTSETTSPTGADRGAT